MEGAVVKGGCYLLRGLLHRVVVALMQHAAVILLPETLTFNLSSLLLRLLSCSIASLQMLQQGVTSVDAQAEGGSVTECVKYRGMAGTFKINTDWPSRQIIHLLRAGGVAGSMLQSQRRAQIGPAWLPADWPVYAAGD
jgi:hypothetical protein